jgi:hypothetical protein
LTFNIYTNAAVAAVVDIEIVVQINTSVGASTVVLIVALGVVVIERHPQKPASSGEV